MKDREHFFGFQGRKNLYSRQRSKQRYGGVRANDTLREWQKGGDGCCTGCWEGLMEMERERLAGT